jgi:hypothetical protein
MIRDMHVNAAFQENDEKNVNKDHLCDKDVNVKIVTEIWFLFTFFHQAFYKLSRHVTFLCEYLFFAIVHEDEGSTHPHSHYTRVNVILFLPSKNIIVFISTFFESKMNVDCVMICKCNCAIGRNPWSNESLLTTVGNTTTLK